MKILLFIFIITININAQQNNTQAALYNIGLGGITSSIGAALNKKPNEKLGKVMLKGFWQGALGGSIVYGSKQMVYNYHSSNDLNKLWKAKLINSIGVSMIENAALNNNFYDKWHINIGFNRLEYDTKNKKINYKVMPVAFVGTILSSNKSKFNLKYSLQTLTPVFITKRIDKTTTFVSSIRIEENVEIKRSLAHEFIHVLQYDDYMSINVFFNKQKNKYKQKNSFIEKSSKWIYMDIPSAAILRSSYLIENINQKCYFDNFYENEANFYSNKYICP